MLIIWFKPVLFLAVACLCTLVSSSSIAHPRALHAIFSDFSSVSYSNGYYYCVGSNGTMLQSADSGQNWKALPNYTIDDNLIGVRSTSNYTCVLSTAGLLQYTSDHIHWISRALSKCNTFSSFLVKDSLCYALSPDCLLVCNYLTGKGVDSIDLNGSLQSNSIVLSREYVYISASKGRVLKFRIDSPHNVDTLYLPFANNCISCPPASRLQFVHDVLYVCYNNNLYASVDQGKGWTLIAGGDGEFFFADSLLCQLIVVDSSAYNSACNVEMYSYPVVNGRHIRTKYSQSASLYYTAKFALRSVTVVGSTIIAVGSFNTIVRSTNTGLDWCLISNQGARTALDWINSCVGYGNLDGRLYRTHNRGATWLPQLLSSSRNFAYSGIMTQYVLDSSNIILFDQYARGNDPNIVFSKDGGISTTAICFEELRYTQTGKRVSIIKVSDGFLATCCKKYQGNDYTITYHYDSNFANPQQLSVVDSTFFFTVIKASNGLLYALAESRGSIRHNAILASSNFGNSWKTLLNFDPLSTFLSDSYEYEGNLIYSTFDIGIGGVKYNHCKVSRYNIASNVFDIVYDDTASIMHGLIRYSKGIAIGTTGGLYRDSSISRGQSDWYYDVVRDGLYVKPLISDSSCLCFATIDSTSYPNVYYFYNNLEELSNIATEQLCVSHMLASPSYPNPATDYVMLNLVTFNIADVKSLDITVYNSHGDALEKNGKFTVCQTQSTGVQILWSLEGIIPGLYYVVFRIGTVFTTSPVMVIK